MDLLQEIFRSNGRQVASHHHDRTEVREDRGRFCIRGMNLAPTEVVSVYLTGEEIDRLTALRRRQLNHAPAGLFAALGILGRFGGIRETADLQEHRDR
jgi:hypothetical protein